jgi:hypothetical protein
LLLGLVCKSLYSSSPLSSSFARVWAMIAWTSVLTDSKLWCSSSWSF